MSILLRLFSAVRGEKVARLSDSYDLEQVQQQLDQAWELGSATTVLLHQGGELRVQPDEWQRMSVAHEWLMPDGSRDD